MTSRHAFAEAGFTLAEVAVALVLLGVTLVAVLDSVALALRAQAAAEHQLHAMTVADWKMNELAALSAESLATFDRVTEGEVELPSGRYSWRAAVAREADASRLFRLAVVVAWDTGDYALETLAYRPLRTPLRNGASP